MENPQGDTLNDRVSTAEIKFQTTHKPGVTDLRPKEISQEVGLPNDRWLVGGSLGSRNALLVFRSSALANSSETSVHLKPGHKMHITYRCVQAETKLLAKLLECHGITEAASNSNDFNLLWTGAHPKPGVLRSLAPHQRVNHFPRSYELTRKDRLYKNIERMQHAKGYKHFDFIPQTFLMPSEYKELCSSHHRIKGPWIIKPAASSRGRGIYIVETPTQVPLEEPVVVAKYISRPLLIKGHKCDLRLYVAVTSFDPLLIYIYEEGMVRFATVKYDTTHKQLWNPCMHLCNYSINKYHSDYVKSDDPSVENVGHKWTLSALLRHLKSQGKDTASLMSQVEDLVIKAILSSGNSIVTACKMFVPNAANCFELYGFDILIDENLKPWLLEVNLSPSLGCDSPLDVRLKSAMLSDLLTLVGIPAVDPILRPTTSPTNSNKSLKMKLSNCRRVHSADGLSNTLPKKNSNSRQSVNLSTASLTNEELKMLKNVKAQFERRGGFVRIFPAVDSWTKYSQYLEPVTGIPISGSNSSVPFSMMSQHNNNQILYMHLFPDVPMTPPILRDSKHYSRNSLDRKRDSSLDSVRKYESALSTPRQDRYERKLIQGHKSALGIMKKPVKETHSMDLKRQVSDLMKNGKRMSQVEARKTFSQYLCCVLKRISSNPNQEGHIEIVLKFLQKASSYLKSPFNVKIPSHKLSEKDRAAIVAKQLNDFLYLYNRETEMYAELDRPSQIPRDLFSDFLEHARECDLEEVLMLQNVQTVPNASVTNNTNSTTGGGAPVSNIQGLLLRCLPNLTGSSVCCRATDKKSVKVTPLS
ncbi:PREDICTED: tubulin polyglutamylase TTLL5 isoform X2 [Nicrophorus vespilloides]|uniref:Tubulin--tyrosine ligase-like protein 5 n=1 Tax=Nicrophorus vespilloides TaxID=110193 RepID=A0ABM1MYN9_NICVS|nr:PREDICTED: tubulin polyglutamylase TTLL5 isoform X2 [Nicrophorus vespilloides]